MATPDLTPVPNERELPAEVEIDPSAMPAHTPREMSLIQAMTGRSVTEINDDGDRERMFVWFTLRRLGYEPSWDDCADVLIRYKTTPDPTPTEPPTTSPGSAGSGE